MPQTSPINWMIFSMMSFIFILFISITNFYMMNISKNSFTLIFSYKNWSW